MAELVVYVNEQWHTGQLRDISYELATSGKKVVDHLIPLVEAISPSLDWLEGTVEVRDALVPSNVPSNIREQWDRNENWAFQFLASLPGRHVTPARVDHKLAGLLQMFEYFRSPEEASDYLHLEDAIFGRLIGVISDRRVDAFRATVATYEQSRLLRIALYEGDYFTRPPRVEN